MTNVFHFKTKKLKGEGCHSNWFLKPNNYVNFRINRYNRITLNLWGNHKNRFKNIDNVFKINSYLLIKYFLMQNQNRKCKII